jgi:hypothetical protein
MKNKILKFSFLILALVAGLTSCDTEPLDGGVTDGNPNNNNGQASFSVTFSGTQYLTNTVTAEIESGVLSITAVSSEGMFMIQSMGANVGTYQNSQVSFAYMDTESGEMYTSINPISGNSSSMLTIVSINQQNKTINGTFQFVGYKLDEELTVEEKVFSNGAFVNVSYAGNQPVEPENCEEATQDAEEAQTAYENATEEDLLEACQAYRAALENKIELCGDEDGAIQAILDTLNCDEDTPEETAGTITLTAGTMPLVFDIVTVTQEGTLLKILGERSEGTFDYTVYFEVEQDATGQDVFQNFQLSLTSVFYPNQDQPGFEFHNVVDVNSEGVLSGTFGGYVKNADNGIMNITGGTFEIEY